MLKLTAQLMDREKVMRLPDSRQVWSNSQLLLLRESPQGERLKAAADAFLCPTLPSCVKSCHQAMGCPASALQASCLHKHETACVTGLDAICL